MNYLICENSSTTEWPRWRDWIALIISLGCGLGSLGGGWKKTSGAWQFKWRRFRRVFWRRCRAHNDIDSWHWHTGCWRSNEIGQKVHFFTLWAGLVCFTWVYHVHIHIHIHAVHAGNIWKWEPNIYRTLMEWTWNKLSARWNRQERIPKFGISLREMIVVFFPVARPR